MSKAAPPKKVPIPFSQRLIYWRVRFLPIAVWIGAIAVALVIAERQRRAHAPLTGIVEIREAAIASPYDGVLAALEVDLFDGVEEGEVLARMNEDLLLAELATGRAELQRRRAELDQRRREIQWEDLRIEGEEVLELGRLALEEEEARLDVLDREAALQVARVQHEGQTVVLERLSELLEQDVIDRAAYDEAFYTREATAARIAEGETSLSAARELYEQATRRRAAQEDAAGRYARDVLAWLAPLEEAIAVQESFLAEIASRRELLTLRAPISGKVTSVQAHSGQTVMSGAPVLTIADDRADRVIAFVDERHLGRVEAATEVELRTRRTPPGVYRTRVSRLGGQVEEMPEQLRRNPLLPQWGFPVLIEDIPAGSLNPGEVVDIRILPTASGGQ